MNAVENQSLDFGGSEGPKNNIWNDVVQSVKFQCGRRDLNRHHTRPSFHISPALFYSGTGELFNLSIPSNINTPRDRGLHDNHQTQVILTSTPNDIPPHTSYWQGRFTTLLKVVVAGGHPPAAHHHHEVLH